MRERLCRALSKLLRLTWKRGDSIWAKERMKIRPANMICRLVGTSQRFAPSGMCSSQP